MCVQFSSPGDKSEEGYSQHKYKLCREKRALYFMMLLKL